jgi:predicted glycoside hydrolase/deacetylase ChbG (UPF0249 family)
MSLKIIVNADDFGYSKSVNEAICLCFDKKYITSTTLMTNMPCSGQAVNLAQKYGFVSNVGIHLNLTEGKPLTEEICQYSDFATNNEFNHRFHNNIKTRLYITNEEKIAVKNELEAQLEQYKQMGLIMEHMDSHHHMHTDWSVFDNVEFLFKKYGFKSLRISRNGNIDNIGKAKTIYKNIYNRRIRRLAEYTTDYFCGFDDFVINKKFRDKVAEESKHKDISLELMCHPGIDKNGELVNLYIDGPQDALRFEKFSDYIKNYNLITWRELNT